MSCVPRTQGTKVLFFQVCFTKQRLYTHLNLTHTFKSLNINNRSIFCTMTCTTQRPCAKTKQVLIDWSVCTFTICLSSKFSECITKLAHFSHLQKKKENPMRRQVFTNLSQQCLVDQQRLISYRKSCFCKHLTKNRWSVLVTWGGNKSTTQCIEQSTAQTVSFLDLGTSHKQYKHSKGERHSLEFEVSLNLQNTGSFF